MDNKLLDDVQHYINRGEAILNHTVEHPINKEQIIKASTFKGFRSGALSFIQNTYGTDHSYYSEFDHGVVHANFDDTRTAVEILKVIKDEIEHSRGNAKQVKQTEEPSVQSNSKVLGMKPEAFWTLLTAVIGGAFTLGLIIGQAKFDQVKIDLTNANSAYKSVNTSLLQQLGKEQRSNRVLGDSLKTVNEQLNTLLIYGNCNGSPNKKQ